MWFLLKMVAYSATGIVLLALVLAVATTPTDTSEPMPSKETQSAAALAAPRAIPSAATTPKAATTTTAVKLPVPKKEPLPQAVQENAVPQAAAAAAEPSPAPQRRAALSSCSANTYNCDDFSSHAEAQALFEACGGAANDVHGLDRDRDGLACETLP